MWHCLRFVVEVHCESSICERSRTHQRGFSNLSTVFPALGCWRFRRTLERRRCIWPSLFARMTFTSSLAVIRLHQITFFLLCSRQKDEPKSESRYDTRVAEPSIYVRPATSYKCVPYLFFSSQDSSPTRDDPYFRVKVRCTAINWYGRNIFLRTTGKQAYQRKRGLCMPLPTTTIGMVLPSVLPLGKDLSRHEVNDRPSHGCSQNTAKEHRVGHCHPR